MKLLLPHLIDEDNWDSDTLSNLLKIAKLFSVGLEIQNQFFLLQSDVLWYFWYKKTHNSSYFILHKYIFIWKSLEFPTAFTSLYVSFVSINFLCKYFYLSVLL